VQICFVSAQQGSTFMHELLEVVAHAVEREGVDVSLHYGAYPTMPSPCVYVVIPHEYFVLTPPDQQPSPAQQSRTIGFCVEHPGNQTFEVSCTYARSLGGVMDINADSTVELRRRGVPAEQFVLAYSPLWDAWGGSEEHDRPIDITYLGTTDIRRAQLLALQADELSAWRTRLLIPPHEPMIRARDDFLVGTNKLEHLASTKVLINLHRGASRSLEWVRILEAVCNGCVVVSERSLDFGPFVPGEDLLFAEPTRIVATASALLRDTERLRSMRQSAWAKGRSLDMRASAQRLLAMAEAIQGDGGSTSPRRVSMRLELTSHPSVPEPAQPDSELPTLAPWATSLPEPLRKLQASLIIAVSALRDMDVSTAQALASSDARVVALIPDLACDARQVSRTIEALEAQDIGVDAWSGRRISHHPAPFSPQFGRGACLNTLMRATDAELILVIEPGDELFPTSIRRLVDALDASPDSVAAYGMMADACAAELWNALPIEPDRLARRAYLSAPFLIRRSALVELGGVAEDAALTGYEYHDLWCRIAHRGWTAVFVQEIVGRGRRVPFGGSDLAAIAPEIAHDALRRSSPSLVSNHRT
jgi:hypothetical protein